MKFDDKLFEMSKRVTDDFTVSKREDTQEDRLLKNSLMSVLLKRINDILEKENTNLDDLIKIRINSCYWGKPEKGYEEIKELIKRNLLDDFLRDYSMYLGKVRTTSDVLADAFYEIIFDYKTYYENAINYTNENILVLKNKIEKNKIEEYINKKYHK